MIPRRFKVRCQGFSRLDLLAILATAALLVLVATAMASTHRVTPEVILCQENLRRLGKAWQSHATENALVARNPSGNTASTENPLTSDAWALGLLDWTPASDNTNLSKVQIPAFAPYVGTDVGLYRCPSDRFVSAGQRTRGWQNRTRTYVMNGFVNSAGADLFPPNYTRFRTLSDFTSPQATFVFTEEHPDSINDPTFLADPASRNFYDLPASFHDGAATFSFADGHVETHRWQNSRIRQPVRFSTFNPVTTTPRDLDLLWLGERASQLVR